jgi:hypothetical protein
MFSRRQIRQAGKIGGQALTTAGNIARSVSNVASKAKDILGSQQAQDIAQILSPSKGASYLEKAKGVANQVQRAGQAGVRGVDLTKQYA